VVCNIEVVKIKPVTFGYFFVVKMEEKHYQDDGLTLYYQVLSFLTCRICDVASAIYSNFAYSNVI